MAKIQHIVLLTFDPSFSNEEIESVFSDLRDLQSIIPGILSFNAGPNNSPEGLSNGHTHGFVMTFADSAARETYLHHPAHDKVKARLIEMVSNGTVVDLPLAD